MSFCTIIKVKSWSLCLKSQNRAFPPFWSPPWLSKYIQYIFTQTNITSLYNLPGQKSIKFFGGILENRWFHKIHSDIIWPLKVSHIYIFFDCLQEYGKIFRNLHGWKAEMRPIENIWLKVLKKMGFWCRSQSQNLVRNGHYIFQRQNKWFYGI